MQNSCNIIYPSYVNFIWKIFFYLLPPNRYEEEQEHKMAEEIAQFESSLAAEREKETERQTKMMDSLAKRKEELLAEAEKRKQVMTLEICSLSLSCKNLACLFIILFVKLWISHEYFVFKKKCTFDPMKLFFPIISTLNFFTI